MANINNYIMNRYQKDNMMKARSNYAVTGRNENGLDNQIDSTTMNSSEMADEIELLRQQIK